MRKFASSDPSEQEDGPDRGEDDSCTRSIPIVQEEVVVSRVAEKTGGAVRVRVSSHDETQSIPLTDVIEELSVERVTINRFVSERTEPRQEGDVVIIPVFETVPVVELRLLLKEEVRILRQRREVQRETEVVLRKEAAVIERREPGQDDWSTDTSDQ